MGGSLHPQGVRRGLSGRQWRGGDGRVKISGTIDDHPCSELPRIRHGHRRAMVNRASEGAGKAGGPQARGSTMTTTTLGKVLVEAL